MNTAVRRFDASAPSSAPVSTFERRFLSTMLVILFITYASLGKNVFTNGVDIDVVDDPISRNIGYVRFVACLITTGFIIVRFGFGDFFRGVPWLFAPFVFWGVLSSVWADEHWVTFRSSIYLVTILFAMPPIIYKLGLATTVRIVLHMLAVVLILSFLVAVFFPSIGRHTSVLVSAAHAGRWRGIFGHKNGLGPWAAYGTIFLFTHSRMVGGPRLYWAFAWGCAFTCLILSGSATSLVAAIFLVLATLAFRLRHRISGVLLTMLVVTGALSLVLAYIFAKNEFFAFLGRDESFTGRTDVWGLALRHIADNFWLGAGYLSTGGTEFLEDVVNTVLQEIPGAENAYLQAMLELGFTGLVFFFIPVIRGLFRSFALWPQVNRDNQLALEMFILITLAAMVMGCTESTPFICTGYDGVITFPAVFGLALLPSRARIRERLAQFGRRYGRPAVPVHVAEARQVGVRRPVYPSAMPRSS